MRVAAVLLTAVALSGCGDGPCEESFAFAKSKRMPAAKEWANSVVFAGPEYASLEFGPTYYYATGRALAKKTGRSSGLVPKVFTQVNVVQRDDLVDGVVFVKFAHTGVIVSRGDIHEYIRYHALADEIGAVIDDRTAVLCGPVGP